MRKYPLFIFLFCLSLPFLLFTNFLYSSSPIPLIVSVAPTKALVEKIGQDKVSCHVFVPPGASPHSYEPSLRQVIEFSQAKAWFRLGEGFENRVVSVLQDKMQIIDLRDTIETLPGTCCHHHHDSIDTHIWFTPALLKIQASVITNTLSSLAPEEAQFFNAQLEKLRIELDLLDDYIRKTLATSSRKSFLVAHPAFGYFCQKYGLKELSLEINGQEPTAHQITALIQEAQAQKIDLVFSFPQYSAKGAELIAKTLKAKLVSFDPYAENVLENLRLLTQILSE